MSSKDNDEERVIHSKSDNKNFMIHDNPDEVIEELFESVLNRYQIELETSMSGSDLVFVFIYCITNVIKYNQIEVYHI